MDLKQYYSKRVRITDVDGQVFKGVVTDYIYPEDNEPEKESIIIDNFVGYAIEFFEEDISTIEII